MIQLLSKWAIPKVILPLFLLNCLFSFFLFPKYEQQLQELAQEKVTILDKYPTYTMAQVTDLFTKIKEEGRAIHYFLTSVIDMIYPFVYGPFLMLLITFLVKQIFDQPRALLYVAFLIPLLLMLTDYAENMTTLQLLSSFPNLDEGLVSRGSKLANLKIVCILLAGGCALFATLGWITKTLLMMTFNRQR